MSLLDLKGLWRRRSRRGWEGLRPPTLGVGELWRDLSWHRALYAEDGLPVRERLAFLGLRVVQRVSYNLGWYLGGRR